MSLVLGSKRAGSLGELWEVEWWQWFAEWWLPKWFVEKGLPELSAELPEFLLDQNLHGSRQKCISFNTLH